LKSLIPDLDRQVIIMLIIFPDAYIPHYRNKWQKNRVSRLLGHPNYFLKKSVYFEQVPATICAQVGLKLL
jgi:hypothetical protein